MKVVPPRIKRENLIADEKFEYEYKEFLEQNNRFVACLARLSNKVSSLAIDFRIRSATLSSR
jgi:hypothetical protein